MSEAERLVALEVDLSRYPGLLTRDPVEPLALVRDRELVRPILRAMGTNILRQVPDPVMLTHIVTVKCNYSCGFCCFADSLNAKVNEMSLGEVEKTYATIGKNLNVLVYSGGETTLNKDLHLMIEAAYRLTSVQSVYIISNAWKPQRILEITHYVKQRCPDLHLTWSLSIEGPREHNNTVRYTKQAGFDAWQNTVDTLYAIKAMRQTFGYTQLDVQLCTVCTPDNMHLLDDWYLMVRDVLQPDKWNLNLMRKSVQMEASDLAHFAHRRQARQLEPFERKYVEMTARVRQDVMSGKLAFLYHTRSPMDGAMKSAVDLMSQNENSRTVLEQSPTFDCKAGTYGAFIGSEGQVSGCEEFAQNKTDNKTFGNLKDVDFDFQKIWHSDKAKQYRQCVGSSQECVGCTLESQRNYPSILVSFKPLMRAAQLATQLL
jgi:MoaA/NifB/PqqE/SkfB family radical SAM enzyme